MKPVSAAISNTVAVSSAIRPTPCDVIIAMTLNGNGIDPFPLNPTVSLACLLLDRYCDELGLASALDAHQHVVFALTFRIVESLAHVIDIADR